MKLNTTQSAISKRLLELEAAVGVAVFDREGRRGVQITSKGEELLGLAEDILEIRDRASQIKTGGVSSPRRFRLGITETTALTWLPRLVARFRTEFQNVTLEPEVEMSRVLYERLVDGSLDLVVMHKTFAEAFVVAREVAQVQYSWMISPLIYEGKGVQTLGQISVHTLIHQGSKSWSGVYLNQWLQSHGAVFPKAIPSNSLIATIELTIAGIGVSFLPQECLGALVKRGILLNVPTEPAPPEVPYVSMYRNDRPSAFASTVADLIDEVIDFSLPWTLFSDA